MQQLVVLPAEFESMRPSQPLSNTEHYLPPLQIKVQMPQQTKPFATNGRPTNLQRAFHLTYSPQNHTFKIFTIRRNTKLTLAPILQTHHDAQV